MGGRLTPLMAAWAPAARSQFQRSGFLDLEGRFFGFLDFEFLDFWIFGFCILDFRIFDFRILEGAGFSPNPSLLPL